MFLNVLAESLNEDFYTEMQHALEHAIYRNQYLDKHGIDIYSNEYDDEEYE